MIIRDVQVKDAEKLWQLQSALDADSEFMMLEAGERLYRPERTAAGVREKIERGDLLLVVENEVQSGFVGYLLAERGRYRRNAHSAYVVVGILHAYQRLGIGNQLFQQLEAWAMKNAVKRLELTVMSHNQAAR